MRRRVGPASPPAHSRSVPVLLVAHLLHPIGGSAVELLVDGDMRHAGGGGCAMPVLLARRNPDNVARMDLFAGATPPLRPAAAGRHDERLAERVRVPLCPAARLEGD